MNVLILNTYFTNINIFLKAISYLLNEEALPSDGAGPNPHSGFLMMDMEMP